MEDPYRGENVRKIMFFRLDAIMYGVLAAWFKRKFPMGWHKNRLVFFTLGMGFQTAVWLLASNLDFNNSFFAKTFFFSLMPLSFVFLLPVCSAWEHEAKDAFGISIRLMALWSYSLYLCNFLLVQVITNIMEMLGITSQLANLSFYFLYLVLSLVMSAIVYTFLEKPVMDIREQLPSR
ncbi:MAG: hypothetical protein HYZ21_05680 [Chloroflexi bacterium]|nr:hypothetical protein [Chloroflexota bacterium]